MTNWENMTPEDEQRILDNASKLQADPRDPDQIIRDLRDRIEELEPSLRDWKGMAMKAKARVEELERVGKTVPLVHDGDPHGHCHFDCRACAFTRLLNP